MENFNAKTYRTNVCVQTNLQFVITYAKVMVTESLSKKNSLRQQCPTFFVATDSFVLNSTVQRSFFWRSILLTPIRTSCLLLSVKLLLHNTDFLLLRPSWFCFCSPVGQTRLAIAVQQVQIESSDSCCNREDRPHWGSFPLSSHT